MKKRTFKKIRMSFTDSSTMFRGMIMDYIIKDVCKHPVGQRLPWYLSILSCILFPGHIKYALLGGMYDMGSQSIKIDGHWIALSLIRNMIHTSKADIWYRFVKFDGIYCTELVSRKMVDHSYTVDDGKEIIL